MSKRSRQVGQLAALLSQCTRVWVDIGWNGNGSGASYGWHVTWCDGPTETTMRTHAVTLAEHVPAVDIAVLRYDRGWTDLARVAAALTYLADHPEEVRNIATWTVDRAFAISEYPERSHARILNHARALLAQTSHNSSDAALCLIAERGVNPLTTTADDHAGATVIDLSAERTRRQHARSITRIRNGKSRIAEAFTTPAHRWR